MKYQTKDNKSGEIEYRRISAKNDINGFDSIIPMLNSRINETLSRLDYIQEDSVVGEIGAERCQRILALISNYGIKSAYAFDISPDMLNMSKIIGEKLFNNSPHKWLNLVVGDFLKCHVEDKFDILFCFATLHHFPDPKPIFVKVFEMLGDCGKFYFDREPVESALYLHEIVRFLRGGVPERKYGILETQFSLDSWWDSVCVFNRNDVYVCLGVFSIRLDKIMGSKLLKFIVRLTGGRIRGWCYK